MSTSLGGGRRCTARRVPPTHSAGPTSGSTSGCEAMPPPSFLVVSVPNRFTDYPSTAPHALAPASHNKIGTRPDSDDGIGVVFHFFQSMRGHTPSYVQNGTINPSQTTHVIIIIDGYVCLIYRLVRPESFWVREPDRVESPRFGLVRRTPRRARKRKEMRQSTNVLPRRVRVRMMKGYQVNIAPARAAKSPADTKLTVLKGAPPKLSEELPGVMVGGLVDVVDVRFGRELVTRLGG